MSGTYQPQPIKRVSIPKSGGGSRELEIPCALDRFIQQAILQALQPRFDPSFSEHSYGFRPGRRAHDAVRAAQKYIQQGYRFVVRHLFGKLRLRVNEEKSAAARPEDRKFLGYSFWNLRGEVKRRVAPKALKALEERIRQITCRNGGRSIRQVIAELRSYLVWWNSYFRLADTLGVLRALDGWIRRRLRALQLKQWRRDPKVYRKLRARRVPERVAASAAAQAKRWWRSSQHQALKIALPNPYDELGLPRLAS